MTNQALPRSDGKLFCKTRVMVKTSIPPSITEATVRGVLWNWPKIDAFSEERNPDWKWPEIET